MKGQSRSRSGTGRIPAAGCGESWLVRPDQSRGWPGGPGGCDPPTVHSQHQSYGEGERGRELIEFR